MFFAVLLSALRFCLETPLPLSNPAGNFIYLAASDLIPEIKAQPKLMAALTCLAAFLVGLAGMLVVAREVG